MRGCIRIYGRLCCYSKNGGTRNHCPPRRPIASVALHCWKSRIPHRPCFCSYTADPLPFKVMELRSLHLHQEQSSLTAGRIQCGFRRWFLCANRVPPHGEAGGRWGRTRRGQRITNAKRHSALDGRIVSRGRSQLFSPLERFTGAVHESRPQREKIRCKSSLTKSRSANALRLSECVEKQITIQAVSGIVPAQRASSKRNAPVLPLPW